MKLPRLNRPPVWIAAGVIFLVCILHVAKLDFLERVEALTYDMRVRHSLHSGAAATNLFSFVYLDERTLDEVQDGSLGYRFGLYWPRQVYGRLLSELSAQGAEAAGLDVLFGELRPDHPPVQLEGGRLIESDEYFALQLRRCTNSVLAMTPQVNPPALFQTNAWFLGDISTDKDPDGIMRRVRAFRNYRSWHPVLQKLEADPQYGVDLSKAVLTKDKLILERDGLEAIEIPLDDQGRFDLADLVGETPKGMDPRATPVVEKRVWHMGVVLAAKHLGLSLEDAKVNLKRGRIELRGPHGVTRCIPVDQTGCLLIYWAIPPSDQRLHRIPMHIVLKEAKNRLTNSPEQVADLGFKNKLVVVGSASVTGNDLADRGATPFSRDTFLVSKHWNVANSIVANRFVRQSSMGVDLLLITLLGIASAILTWKLRAITAVAVVLAIAGGYIACSFAAYSQTLYWVPVAIPVLGALMMTHVCLVAWRVVFEQAARRKVAEVLSTIVSPKIARELLRAQKLTLGGSRREITVMFADVRGFTELTDSLQQKAEEYVREHHLEPGAAEAYIDEQARVTLSTVNLYLGALADTVITHDGTLDKFIGDCVMAFWGAPTVAPGHAAACVRAAIEGQRAIKRLNVLRESENQRIEEENRTRAAGRLPVRPSLPILQLGTGINTGMATVGLMGSEVQTVVRQGNYTVFGRDVNLASRLESLSGSGRIFISQSTYEHLKRDDPTLAATCVPLEPVTVKGIRDPIKVYEVPWKE